MLSPAPASLMWGYGVTGTRWGSWVTNISTFLSPGLDVVLADSEAHLTAGEIAKAYRQFTRPGPGGTELENHHGIGFPYITKILYFLARNSPDDAPAEYPLILDTDVSFALAQLTGYRLLVRPADYRPRPDSMAYVQYVLPDSQDERGGGVAGERVHDVNGPARRSRAGLVFEVSP